MWNTTIAIAFCICVLTKCTLFPPTFKGLFILKLSINYIWTENQNFRYFMSIYFNIHINYALGDFNTYQGIV